MKTKILLLFIIFSLKMEVGISQENRGWVTITIFEKLFGYSYDPEDHFASNYASPYLDHIEPTDVSAYARVLSYLEYEDGISVLPREWTYFNSPALVTRAEFLKMALEAWDAELIEGGGMPYVDVDEDNPYYLYILTAYYHGLIPYATYFYPNNYISYSFATSFLDDLPSEISTPSYSERHDEDNFYIPFNINPYTLGVMQGAEHGAFSHYAKNSFVIPDRMMNLNFSHFYNSAMVEMHQDFYPIQPLTRGWSHTYNAYIVLNQDVTEDEIDYFHIVWPDGTIHIYGDNEYVTKGVYDEFDEIGADIIVITKKDQTEYRFEKIDGGRDIYYLVEIEDRFGNGIDIEYESAEEEDTRRIEYVEAPSGKRLNFFYLDDTDFIEKISDPIGRDILFEFTGIYGGPFYHPILVQFKDAKGNATTYQYGFGHPHEIHLLKRIDLPRGNQIKAQYNPNGKLKKYQINDEAEVEIEVDFDYEDEEFHTEIRTPLLDGEEFIQNYTFNENGLVTEYLDNNSDIEIDYPGGGINVMLPGNTNMNGVDIEYDYDSRGNVTRIDMEDGMSVQEFDYNDDNTLDYYTDANGNTTHYYYDDGTLVEIKDALGNSQFFTYDGHGQMLSSTNQVGITTNFLYESDGAVNDITMPEGIHHTFIYDGVNRMTQHNDNGIIEYYGFDLNDNLDSISKGGYTTYFNYDENDNLAGITNAIGTLTLFEYDDEDRIISETFGDLTRVYDYNDEGQLVDITKPSGSTIEYEYDDDGRLEETGTISNIEYNSRNLIEEISVAGVGTTYLNYDDLNRLETSTDVHGFVVAYEYDDGGNIKKIIYPEIDGVEFYVNYQYDEKNRMTDVHLHHGDEYTHVAEYLYRDDVLLEYVIYGNHIRGHQQYDNAGRKESIAFSYIEGPLEGTVMYATELTLNSRGNAISQYEYFYDGYSESEYTGTASSQTYNYDENNHLEMVGDLVNEVDEDGNTTLESHEYVFEGETYSYEYIYTYNLDDRLIKIERTDGEGIFPIEYKYDGFGLQVERSRFDTEGVEYTEYFTRDVLSGNLLMESNDRTSDVRYHVYGATGLEVTIDHYGEITYYLGDLRGSVIAEVGNDPEETLYFNHYDDFGKEIYKGIGGSDVTELPTPHQYRYLGKHGVIKEIGNPLYNVNRRYYNPEIGRFLTEDPIWSTNLYPYADNNPITKIDPSGAYPISTSEITPFGVGVEWLTGTGPRHRSFNGGDYFTELLRRHGHIEATMGVVSSKIGEGIYSGRSNYSLSGIEGVGLFLKDYSSLITGGRTGNLATTYLGSYQLSWDVLSISGNEALVSFSIDNSSTIQSLLRPPLIGYKKWWQNSIGSYLNNQFSSGPMSKTTQSFNWIETISW